ncbi:MaoC family dehydratase [Flavonifractor sp. HCP28S3_F3]|uniref:MaoC family dehydratase n=1 Tax=Flavonifractor sp. HCP28S3_F3 TaxID=3438939 RepID=UPI003F8AB745
MSEPFFIPYADIHVGDRASRSDVITEDIVTRFSQLIGDTDSFHISEESAARTVFQRRIAHGIHIATFISTLVGQKLPGFGTIYCSQTFDFQKPVYLGETIRTEVTVLEKLPHRRLRMQTTVTDSAGEVVLDGIAVIKTYQ